MQENHTEWWWRDDDATEDTPALRRLLALSTRYAVPVLLAVIPGKLHPSFVSAVRSNPLVTVAQHGWCHTNHAHPGEKASEYPAHRPAETILQEVSAGYALLQEAFAAQFVPIFVPPWNRLSPVHHSAVHQSGLRSLSTFGSPQAPHDRPATVDILRWHPKPPVFVGETAFAAALAASPAPLGLLTHHLVHDENTWDALETFLSKRR